MGYGWPINLTRAKLQLKRWTTNQGQASSGDF